MSWSRVVRDPAEALRAISAPGSEVDLRAAGDLDDTWAALGFGQLAPGELVRPVDLALADLAATRALGSRLARSLRAGDLLVLTGPLGAGKTSLTQGLAEGLGVRGAVTSPTFVLARAHRGPLPLLHVDAYRLQEAPDPGDVLADLDLELALEDGVVVVEWGEGLVEQVGEHRLHVTLQRPRGTADSPAGAPARSARVRAHGARWAVLPPA